jgi:hypothetical protein
MRIYGSCHCGNISFDLDWEPDPVEIPARACGCTFCQKHGGVWTSYPAGTLHVEVKDPKLLSKYAFGTHTATFHVCRQCGGVPVVTSMIESDVFAVVNVNAFDNVDRSLLKPAPISFDGEDVGSRIARRRRNWIGKVDFPEARTSA